MKILTIIGARPQFIKAAMLSRQLSLVEGLQEIVVHTGQHYDVKMSEVFFSELDIPQPGYNLGIGGGSHGQNTGRMIEAIEKVLIYEQPSIVLVYGDTDSTLAGALAAVKLHIPVAHIEAGLRSFNRLMPEEINRVLVDHCSKYLFAPTQIAMRNLTEERILRNVHLVGDVMYDAALYYGKIAEKQSDILKELRLLPQSYILATIHRQENADSQEKLKNIITTLNNAPLPVIFPIHPRTKSKLDLFEIKIESNVTVIEPMGYLDMIMLEKNSALIATDSGGIQKEAYFHNVPCVIFRGETEWKELIDIQACFLVDFENPLATIEKVLEGYNNNFPTSIYGQGDTALNIVDVIIDRNI